MANHQQTSEPAFDISYFPVDPNMVIHTQTQQQAVDINDAYRAAMARDGRPPSYPVVPIVPVPNSDDDVNNESSNRMDIENDDGISPSTDEPVAPIVPPASMPSSSLPDHPRTQRHLRRGWAPERHVYAHYWSLSAQSNHSTAQYRPVPAAYAPVPETYYPPGYEVHYPPGSRYLPDPEPDYPPLPEVYPPPSPPASPSDLALSDNPTPPSSPTTPSPTSPAHAHVVPFFATRDALAHLAPLTSEQVVDRYAYEEANPPFRPRYYVPAPPEWQALLSLSQRPALVRRRRDAVERSAIPARPASTRRRRRGQNAVEDEPRPARPAVQKQRTAGSVEEQVAPARPARPAVQRRRGSESVDEQVVVAPARRQRRARSPRARRRAAPRATSTQHATRRTIGAAILRAAADAGPRTTARRTTRAAAPVSESEDDELRIEVVRVRRTAARRTAAAAAPRTATTAAPRRTARAAAPPPESDDDDESEFDSGSEIGEPDSDFKPPVGRRRR